ncbi:MAG: DctP family TRAP transporter solute-binding subunit [Clostridiales bacterium]|nr:DctP family TRAP transporter solute-binding subunit [Clostridiales bacterium]
MKKIVSIVLILTLVLGMTMLAGCGGGAETGGESGSKDAIKLIYTHYQPGTPDQPKQAAALAFEAFVENATNGEIEVEIYPNSELGDGPAVLEAMQANTIQMTVVHDGPVSALYAPMGVFNLPFLFESHAEAWTIYDSDYTKKLGESMLEATGIRLLALADNGVRHLTNSVRPIKSIDDAKGLTIRIQPSAIYNAIISGIGANAVEVAWSELPAALQQGVADGQENGITNILAANLYETQKYITLDGHVYSYHAYLISEEFYQSLTAEQQAIIQQGVDLAKWIHRGMTSYQDNTIKPVLTSYGMEVTELTPEALKEFREATQPTVVEWMKSEYGGTWVEDLLAEVEALRN